MKKIIFAVMAVLFSAFTMSAQVATNSSNLEFRKGSFYQNGNKLSADQLYYVLGADVYNSAYKPAKAMKTSGIVLLSVGGAATAIGTGILIDAIVNANKGGTGEVIGGAFETGFSLYFLIPGVIVAGTGGALLGVGNSKMKKIVPAKSGAGLAFNF